MMSCSLVELVITGGIRGLRCPITGRIVIDEEHGFDEKAEHSPYLRFFVDWVGGIWSTSPDDLPEEQKDYQKKIIDIWEHPGDNDNQNALVDKCVSVLPKSTMVLEILDPPYAMNPGAICYMCFDLSEPAEKELIRLHEGG